MVTTKLLRELGNKYNGTFKGLEAFDHDGATGPTAVFLWDDEDDSDRMLDEAELPGVVAVTHEHNARGILESRVRFDRPVG